MEAKSLELLCSCLAKAEEEKYSATGGGTVLEVAVASQFVTLGVNFAYNGCSVKALKHQMAQPHRSHKGFAS